MLYCRIDKYGSKEKKENIFQIEARESQQFQIRAVAEKVEREKAEQEPFLPEVKQPLYPMFCVMGCYCAATYQDSTEAVVMIS